MSSKVSAGAIAYAKHDGAQRIFCGHTHHALKVEQDGIGYYNSGGWVDSRLTYLTIDETGVKIHEFDDHAFDKHESEQHEERTDHRDSGEERGKADSTAADFADDSGLLEDVEYESVGR